MEIHNSSSLIRIILGKMQRMYDKISLKIFSLNAPKLHHVCFLLASALASASASVSASA